MIHPRCLRLFCLLLFCLSLSAHLLAQSAAAPSSNSPAVRKVAPKHVSAAAKSAPDKEAETPWLPELRKLAVVESFVTRERGGNGAVDWPQADGKGNVYVLTGEGPQTIIRIEPEGGKASRIDLHAPADSNYGHGLGYAIGDRGEIFQLVHPNRRWPDKSAGRAIFQFHKDGRYEKTIRLRGPSDIEPLFVAVYPDGKFLAYGTQPGRDDREGDSSAMFTGIFSEDGELLREVQRGEDALVSGQAWSSSAGHSLDRGTNPAALAGSVVMAGDGNAYVLHYDDKPEIVAISESGEVVRTFRVDPGDSAWQLWGHLVGSQSQLAMVFQNREKRRMQVLVTDLSGTVVRRYELPRGAIAPELAGFDAEKQEFTFLTVDADGPIGLLKLMPQ